MARTAPEAGRSVNSEGRARASTAVLPCHWVLDSSDVWTALDTLAGPEPSPRTRKENAMGTREVLNRVQVRVWGKPAAIEREREGRHRRTGSEKQV